MNRILIASALVLGFAGAAAAQDDYFLQGNYSANVLNQVPGKADVNGSIDMTGTASIPSSSKQMVEPGAKSAPSSSQLDYGY